MVSVKEFKKDEFLLSPGQICERALFVEKGLVRFYSIDEEGKEHIVQFAPENWFVGDRESIYFRKPSVYYMDAIEDTTVILFDQHFVETASEISPEFRNYNEYLLQNHIRHLQNRINLLIGASAEKRYLDFIKLYPDLTLRVPQWMIASYLGITPESLSRVRKELSKRNFKPA
ncbi:Anaerobic regulatory protein [compost metagenome]